MQPKKVRINEQQKHHNFGDTIGVLGVAVALILFALNSSFTARAACFLIATVICVYLAYQSHFVRNWSYRARHIAATLIFFALIVLGAIQLVPQWRKERASTAQSGTRNLAPPETHQSPTAAKAPVPTVLPPMYGSILATRRVPQPVAKSPHPKPAASIVIAGDVNQTGDGCQQKIIGGNNNTNSLNCAPARLELTDAQSKAITDAMASYSGHSVIVLIPNQTSDSFQYGVRLAEALNAAHLIADPHTLITTASCTPGVSFAARKGADFILPLKMIMESSGAAKGGVKTGSGWIDPADLYIWVCPY